MNAIGGYLHHLLTDSPHRWHPLLGVFYLTYRCDFRCPYCSDGACRPYYALPSPVLPAAKVKDLLTAIRRHCPYVVLTGGEPLQHTEFSEVMADIPALRFRRVILTTNGYALDRFLEVVVPAVHGLVFSVGQRGDHARAASVPAGALPDFSGCTNSVWRNTHNTRPAPRTNSSSVISSQTSNQPNRSL